MSTVFSSVASGGATPDDAVASSRPRFLSSALLFAVLYITAFLAAEVTAIPRGVRIGIAILPVPAFGFFLLEWIRGIRRLDELERKIQLEALAVAFPLTLMLIMGLGLIQRVTVLNPMDWSYRHIWPFLIAFYFFGLALARRRYR